MDVDDPGGSNGLWECVCKDEETIQLDINWIVEHSGYFSGLMRSDMRETKQRKLNLCLFSADTVAFMIELLSCRNKKQSMIDLEDAFKSHFSFNNVEEVLRLIDYLDIPCLYPKCCEVLNELIPGFCANICRLWKFWVLCEDYDLESVEKQMSAFLAKELKDFVAMDDLYLKELPIKLFEGILSEEGLDVKSELEVMSMIETWINYNQDQRLDYFDDLFKCVSIPSMIHAEWKEIQEKVSKLTGKTIDLLKAYSAYVRNPHVFLTDFPHMTKSRNSWNVIISFGGIYEYSIRNAGLDMQGTGQHNRYRMSSLPMFYVIKDKVFEGPVTDNYQGNVENLRYKRQRLSSRADRKSDIDMRQFPDLKSPVKLVEFGLCTYEGFVYIMGGQRQMIDAAIFSVRGCLRLDPCRGDWQEVSCMNEGRCLFCLLPVWNRIYAVGGANEYGTLQSTACYLPLEDTWKEGPNLPTPLYKHAGCVFENCIYISGGHNADNYTDKVWFLGNPQGHWKPSAPLLRSRSYHSMAAVNGKLYVVGGASYQQNGIKDIYSVEEYDPKTDIWTNVMQLNVPIGDCLPIISDHQLLFIGGYSFSEKVYLQQAVTIDTKQKHSKVSAVTFHSKFKKIVGYGCANVKINRKFCK